MGLRKKSSSQLAAYIQANAQSSETNVDAAFILSPAGIVLSASKPEWIGLDLSGSQVIQEISNTSKSLAAFSPSSLYTNQWMILIQPAFGR